MLSYTPELGYQKNSDGGLGMYSIRKTPAPTECAGCGEATGTGLVGYRGG